MSPILGTWCGRRNSLHRDEIYPYGFRNRLNNSGFGWQCKYDWRQEAGIEDFLNSDVLKTSGNKRYIFIAKIWKIQEYKEENKKCLFIIPLPTNNHYQNFNEFPSRCFSMCTYISWLLVVVFQSDDYNLRGLWSKWLLYLIIRISIACLLNAQCAPDT